MEEHQNAVRVAAWSDRPLSGDAVESDGAKLHVLSHRPSGAYFVKALPALRPTGRPRRLQIGRSTLYRKLEALGLNEGRGAANGEEEAVATARQPVKIA